MYDHWLKVYGVYKVTI